MLHEKPQDGKWASEGHNSVVEDSALARRKEMNFDMNSGREQGRVTP